MDNLDYSLPVLRTSLRRDRGDTTETKKNVKFREENQVVHFSQISCPTCGLEFQTAIALKEHEGRAHERKWVRCLVCVKIVKHQEHFVI